MSLEVGGRGAREGGGWLQNHKECRRMLRISVLGEWAGGGRLGSESKELHETVIISCLWKWVGGGRVAPESQEMHGTVSIFMVWEVGGKLAAGLRVNRNAYDSYHFDSFGSASNA